MPKPLEHLANAPRGRYVLSGGAVFAHRGQEWAQRITSAMSVSYTLTCRPGRAGRYLTASWAALSVPYWVGRDNCAPGDHVHATGPVVGVDLNDGQRVTSRRPSPPRHHPANPLHAPARHSCDRGRRPRLRRRQDDRARNHGSRRRFRRTVSGIPTAVFRNRLTGMAARAGIQLFEVNPAYSSIWGAQHWRRRYPHVTRTRQPPP